MDVFNKVYSTVSSTVSQLSTVLPGNPVTREYEVIDHIASAGPGLLWKVFSAFKKSTNESASIFLLEKKQLDKFSKSDREAILEALRKGVSQLSRLRHPRILVVQHTLEESRESLAFATEPVFASLSNVLGNFQNTPSLSPTALDNYKLLDIEIKHGIMQVGEGLSFLHEDVKLLHRNLCPENVVINKEGSWKIFGFDFSLSSISDGDGNISWPNSPYRKESHFYARPNLDFLAPESGLSGKCSPNGDTFSLGMLIYAAYNGKPWRLYANNWNDYQGGIGQIKRLKPSELQSVNGDLRNVVHSMLCYVPEHRPKKSDFLQNPFFDDVCLKALNFTDCMFQYDNLQKSKFYKGLPQIIERLPSRVCLNKLIPNLKKEFVDAKMVPFVLPNIFEIAKSASKEEFKSIILPALRPVLTMKEPIQILLILMQNMETLLSMSSSEDVKKDILPVLFRALESPSEQIQRLSLSILPTFAPCVNSSHMKSHVLPLIKKLCLTTPSLSIRVLCLVCIGKLMDNFDKWLVMDEVVPFLPQIKCREAATIMSITGVYQVMIQSKKFTLSHDVLANSVLVFLIPLSVEDSLNVAQFQTVHNLITKILGTVTDQQLSRLNQLAADKQINSNIGAIATNGDAKDSDDLESLFKAMAECNGYSVDKKVESVLKPVSTKLNPFPIKNLPKDLTSTLSNETKQQRTDEDAGSNISFHGKNYPNFPAGTRVGQFAAPNTTAVGTRQIRPEPARFSVMVAQRPQFQVPSPSIGGIRSNVAVAAASSSSSSYAPNAFFGNVVQQGDRTAAKKLTPSEINDFLNLN